MSVTERARHELHERLVELMGRTHTATLMAHLPPTGWGDVATKADLDHLEARIDHRFESLEQRMDALEERMELRMEAQEHRLTSVIESRARQTNAALLGTVLSFSAVLITAILTLR
jgi:hypothetical protein